MVTVNVLWSVVIEDHYTTLDVSRSASQAEITAAYRALVSKYHPDKHENNELKELAVVKMRQINEAYSVLSDAQRRAQYDAHQSLSGAHNPTYSHRNRQALSKAKWAALAIGVAYATYMGRNPKVLIGVIITLVIVGLARRLR
tara:strand:+ start:133 stop:561 length:429 start_codon:yes stop_codon:yes gene_type:complete